MPKGGANSYQAIKSLAKMERRYELEVDINGNVDWKERDIEKGNALSFANVPILKHSSMSGQFIVLPFHVDYNYADFLIDIFDAGGGYDCIVELGCGYGRNLFEIYYRGGARDVPYFGGEFTASGEKIAAKLAEATAEMNATFFHFNHLKPDLSILRERGFERVFVFTCHTIEQVAQIPDEWFKEVASIGKHVRCIHLEPYGFQSKSLGRASDEHHKFMSKQGWNQNFLDVLLRAKDNGEIMLDDTVLEIGCGDPLNPGSIACWHKDN